MKEYSKNIFLSEGAIAIYVVTAFLAFIIGLMLVVTHLKDKHQHKVYNNAISEIQHHCGKDSKELKSFKFLVEVQDDDINPVKKEVIASCRGLSLP